ncbi:acetyltransferase (GNAT) family protein [Yoonia maricola]|uniref:Acetyltransferase (GNAT) family protein n=1 Tax=Yoonia maricola TaxID=420999 RepID=A0A2M8W5K9_9RHOB|nr:GNAT family N-acetyltransferase [Yoonia maricola]PJI86217.1 acetyltransferase (GNAT) family protein [Yoonia maricola]
MRLECRPPTDPNAAIPLLKRLRIDLPDEVLADRFAAAQADGYRLLAAHHGTTIVGVLGYVVNETLHWGRTLFVDDLIVDADQRGRGIGAALITAARDHGIAQGCDHLRLCSGLNRHDAHRFYEMRGMRRSSYQFILPLKET